MPAAAEIQTGTPYVFGLGDMTFTGIATMNAASLTTTDNFTTDTIASQNGAVIETEIHSKRFREVEIEFIPAGATRAAALAIVASLFALTPGQVLTFTATSTTATGRLNTQTFNYQSGGNVKQTREGFAVAGIKAKQFETTGASGTFAALAIAT